MATAIEATAASRGENNLEFIKSQTIEQFKAEHGTDSIKVKPQRILDANKQPVKDANGNQMYHPKEANKLFFTWGPSREQVGSVTNKPIENPIISKVRGNDGVEFYLLHNEGTGGAPTVMEF